MKKNRKEDKNLYLDSIVRANKRADKAVRLANELRKLYQEAAIREIKAERKELIERVFSGYEADCMEHLVFALRDAKNQTPEEISLSLKKYETFRDTLYKRFEQKRTELRNLEVLIGGKARLIVID